MHLDTVMTAESIDSTHPAHGFIRERQDDFVAEMISTLTLERAAGRIRNDLDLLVVARQFVALLSGIQSLWLYDSDIDVEHHMQEFLRLLAP